jgi:hypothetical protein
MKVYFVSFVEDGKRQYWKESLNKECAIALSHVLAAERKQPKIVKIKATVKVFASCGSRSVVASL